MKELVKLAKEKKYYGLYSEGEDSEYIWHSEMCDLQKWLRTKHNIVVSIIPHFYGYLLPGTTKYRYKIFIYEDNVEYDNWEQCLEIALCEALNQIKI